MGSGSTPSVDQVRDSLVRLRQGPGLSRPTVLLTAMSEPVRAYLCRGEAAEFGGPEEVRLLLDVLHSAIRELSDDERLSVEVDLNLAAEHRYPTLTERQESLARHLRCATKTVRRRANQAFDTLAYLLLVTGRSAPPAQGSPVESRLDAEPILREFWGLHPDNRVDIVCSEIPSDERPAYASPNDRNYLRYAKFADLDSLMFLRTRFAQLAPSVPVRDFAPSEYFDTQVDVLVVVGGPPWNAKFREFLPQLPFHFEAHDLGQDDPLVVPILDDLRLGPRWTPDHDLVEDIAVLARLTLQSTTVFLLGGCLTLGVLGAARCLLDADRGHRAIDYLRKNVDTDDFVVVFETRRVGGLIDTADLAAVGPLLLLTRTTSTGFEVRVDNTHRYGSNGARPR